MSTRRPRVMLGPQETSNYYTGLYRGFERLGVECTMLWIYPDPYGAEAIDPPRWWTRRALVAARSTYGLQSWDPRMLLSVAGRTAALADAVGHADVVVFSGGRSFFRHLDLRLLSALGKKIVCIFHGSDSRPPYLNGKLFRIIGSGQGVARRAERVRRRVDEVDRLADIVVDNPLSGHFHSRPFVNWFEIGTPAQPSPVRSNGRDDGMIRVVHAPSDPESKGSPLIEKEIERLRTSGAPVELVKLMGRSTHEVQDELARCDFVVDQLYSDVPGAGLAFEAAAHGKPTIVCGFGAQEFSRWVPDHLRLPTHYCIPDQVGSAIDQMVEDVDYRLSLGARARTFIEQECRPEHVAGRLLEVITDDELRRERSVQPDQISYLHGYGLSDDAARRAVSSVLEAAGPGGLQLDDKPELRNRLQTFAGGL